MGFDWNLYSTAWDTHFELLKKYKDANGNCFVPLDYRNEDGVLLGSWAANQRDRKSRLSSDRIKRLDGIGFKWGGSYDQRWNEAFFRLEKYSAENGNCLVPVNYKMQDGFALGSWVQTQRKSQATLPSDRKKQLDKLGFSWGRQPNHRLSHEE